VVRELIEGAEGLDAPVRHLALEAFRWLANAEGHVHGVDPESVEFHEVGSNDAIADIVGAAQALVSLGVSEVVASPVPLGRGLTVGAHGPIPLPGPATLELLRGVPVEGTELAGETVTPTGAALLRAITTRFGRAPAMTIEAVGVGGGKRSWPDRPNIVRAILGRAPAVQASESREDCVIEANIDDMSAEHLGALKRALFNAGAIDVWSAPVGMKKDRLGTKVAALARRSLVDVIAAAFFTHSTTLGVRSFDVSRIRADRRVEEVETPYGRVRVKIADRPSGPPLVAPEYDDVERLAEASGVSLRAVSEAALKAAWSRIDPTT
ncbi:LarC family nickel insertion protein, partial [Myxococcota bacterium]|nr:LarC family nickel insertion protein [Myxococcota bacterium]